MVNSKSLCRGVSRWSLKKVLEAFSSVVSVTLIGLLHLFKISPFKFFLVTIKGFEKIKKEYVRLIYLLVVSHFLFLGNYADL